MNLQLFSSPGNDLKDILAACRQVLEGREDPLIAYFPAASLSDKWQEYTEKAFHGLGRVATIHTELQTLTEMEAILREAALVYIPGGNTFLLNHRLHISKIIDYLRKKVTAGLPVVAFSAGTVLCGPNILTSGDINMVETGHFTEKRRKAPCFSNGDIRREITPAMRGV
jgi:peptidase E